MNITITGRNFEYSDSLKEYAEKKIGKLEKYFDHIDECKITMTVEGNRHIFEATVPINGFILRAEEESNDMYAAIDKASDKLERQIEKYKTKLYKKIKHKNLGVEDIDIKEDEPSNIVKTKKFSLKPMDIEEAILQMEMLGHDFFVYRDSQILETCVVYKRKDGHYGLIEPEI